IAMGLTSASAQFKIQGTVKAYNHGQSILPLSGAQISWLNDDISVLTDVDGKFQISSSQSSKTLIVHYPNFRNDTLLVNRPNIGLLVLKPEIELKEVVIGQQNSPVQ